MCIRDSPQTDAHYLGLQRSVMIAIHRIQESITMDEETRHAVVPLLVALALLPRANTPHRLLHGSRFAAGPEGGGGCLAVFEDGQLLARALAVLRQYGLLQDGIPDMIGTMHQLVQRAVLERWLPEGGAAAEGIGELVIPAVRRTLQEGFQSETGLNMGLRPASEWPRFRELVPCVQRWRQLLSRGCIQETEADGHLISELAGLLMTLGEHHEALALNEEVLEFDKRVRHLDHPHTATSMSNLASSYTWFGRHEEALALHKEALAFFRRVRSPNDQYVVASMASVASSHEDLAQFSEATRLREEVLELQKRVMPPNPQHIAISRSDLASSYCHLGRYDEAVTLREEVLRFHRDTLPAHHQHIATSASRLAISYSTVSRHDEAVKLEEEALQILRRVLPADHFNFAAGMTNLASRYSVLERHDEAMALHEEAMAIQRRARPTDHPCIAMTMHKLAVSCHQCWQKTGSLPQLVRSLELMQGALEIRHRALPANHPDTVSTSQQLDKVRADLKAALPRVKRNEPCPCGSKVKSKNCTCICSRFKSK
eukprot:TRINITY_DN8196_c0_g2_i1.p1 TRINITY_DN8196_c0_g2~~TRINITY_DN8196_c0_g2_i1.p1  ORF type:complete len:543 (-),score=94.90 TRINITY_DN8196_c0_g2_i1:223-1851(-)